MNDKDNKDYEKLCSEYDRLGAELEDAIEAKDEEQKATLKKQMDELENQIHAIEHGYANESKKIAGKFKVNRYTYFKGYKKLKNVKLFENFDKVNEGNRYVCGTCGEIAEADETQNPCSNCGSKEWEIEH